MCSDEVYICFKEAERPKWFMRWLKKGFSHCFILEPYKGKWIKYEAGHRAVRVDLFDSVDSLIEGCIIVKHKRSKSPLFAMFSCVGFVKAVAGISGFAVTPYQLYKRLRAWDSK